MVENDAVLQVDVVIVVNVAAAVSSIFSLVTNRYCLCSEHHIESIFCLSHQCKLCRSQSAVRCRSTCSVL